jgi:hypothetical protein
LRHLLQLKLTQPPTTAKLRKKLDKHVDARASTSEACDVKDSSALPVPARLTWDARCGEANRKCSAPTNVRYSTYRSTEHFDRDIGEMSQSRVIGEASSRRLPLSFVHRHWFST